MSFLAPLFLFGALAIGLPIVFHLIRRTSREKVPFSSLMFLLPTPPRVTRRSRLEHIFLLILRCIVLCLLALGFARPFLQRPVAAEPPSNAMKRIVVLVDTSASMRRANLWADARAKAEDVLNKASPVDKVALFTFDQQARALVNFEQWSAMAAGERASLAAQRLAEVKPGWASTHLGNALITAAETFEQTDKKEQVSGPRRIVLISDLQEGSKLDGLQGYEWPRGIELVVEPIKARRPTNAGLQLVTERDDSYQATTNVATRVRLSNSADAKREQFQIGWARPGERGIVGSSIDVYVPPGQSRVVQAPKLAVGLTEEQLRLTGDDEDFDNAVYVIPPKAEQANILFLGNDSEKDPAQSLYYLKRAFPETRWQTVQILARAADAPISQADIDTAQLIVIADALPENRNQTIKKALQNGKSALAIMKSTATAPSLASLLGFDSLSADEGATGGYAMLGQIDFEHPLFAPFADPRYSDFTKIHFWKYRRVETNKLAGARVLARFDHGDPALIQIPIGKGSLLVITSGWHPADSQLALSSKFVPLLYSLLELSGGITSHKAQYVVGDEVMFPNTPQKISIRKPDGSEVAVAEGGKFTQTDQPGAYVVTSAQPPFRFAVNLAPEECKTAPLSQEELERLGVPVKYQPVETAKQVEQRRRHLQSTELESQQKLWKWLIVAALVVLITETLLAGVLTRRTGVTTAAET